MRFATFAVLALTFSGCALFKPIPGQSIDCAESLAPTVIANAAEIAANAIAGNETVQGIEAAAAPLAEDAIGCEAVALETDIGNATNVANSNGVTVEAVRAHARAYVQARGIDVRLAQ